MTDLAASLASKKIDIPNLSPQILYELLPISGTGPQRVYVSHFKTTDGEHHVGFADMPGGTVFTHGIKWTANGVKDREYAMFITYVFQSPEIQEIECSTLHYSDTYQPTGDPLLHQDMCVPWGKATYAFDVVVQALEGSVKLRVDPIIVVTPL